MITKRKRKNGIVCSISNDSLFHLSLSTSVPLSLRHVEQIMGKVFFVKYLIYVSTSYFSLEPRGGSREIKRETLSPVLKESESRVISIFLIKKSMGIVRIVQTVVK